MWMQSKLEQSMFGRWPIKNEKQIPTALYFDFFAAARQGILPRRFIDDPALKREAVIKTFIETGADAFVIGRLPGPFSYAAGGFPNRIRLPETDLPDYSMWQFEESQPTIFPEDYDYIVTQGWHRFLERLLPRFTGLKPVELAEEFEHMEKEGQKDIESWRKAGVPLMCGAAVTAPFEVLTAGRTMFNFFEDLFVRPDKVLAAMEMMVIDFVEKVISSIEKQGIPAVVLTAHRSSGSLLSPAHFEKFAFPFLEKMVWSFHRAGLDVMLHLDCDWSKNLPYLKEFPPGIIIHTDGSTDLTAAVDILEDRFILMGDVPATLLSRGSPEEVVSYCRKLSEEVSSRAPLILSSGCDVPMDAKMENVLALTGFGNNQ